MTLKWNTDREAVKLELPRFAFHVSIDGGPAEEYKLPRMLESMLAMEVVMGINATLKGKARDERCERQPEPVAPAPGSRFIELEDE